MSIEILPLALEGVFEFVPRRIQDTRGYFSETYSAAQMERAGLISNWVQDNQSLSVEPHTLRGLHFQRQPYAQAKLVRVLSGRVLDVVVDIRRDSAEFGKWLSLELTAERFNQIYVPTGFAHGFITLEPNCVVAYKVSSPYAAHAEASIRWNDPTLAIDWQLNGRSPTLSDKDAVAPLLAEAQIDHV
jgi:dTDP-4-dehydrorhamnose 3,5-epimerase